MLDGYSSDFMSDRTAIQVSWQRVALSRASCVELKRQVAESRRLLQQSRRILAKSQAESGSGGRVSPEGKCRDPRRFRGQTAMICTACGDGIPFDDWCGNELGSLDIPHPHAVQSSRIEDSTSGDPPREIPMQEIVFRIASLVLIGLIYAATALALWEVWQEF